MDLGDIVTYRGARYLVVSRDRHCRICQLSDWQRNLIEVPDDLDKRPNSGLVVVHRPSTWPFAVAPSRAKSGRVSDIFRLSQRLEPLQDWAPSGLFGTGVSLFFNPALGLQTGDVLVLVYERGSKHRLSLSRSFGTAEHKRQRVAQPWKPREPATAYDRLMGDDDPFEDA